MPKESGGVKQMMQWVGNMKQCKGHMYLKELCSSIRATLLNIPKQALCGLYKKLRVGWDEIDGVIMIRNSKGAVGWDRHVTPNKVEYPKRTQLGCPIIHIKFIYYVTYLVQYLIMLQGHNTKITCVRIIIPTITLRVFGVVFGLYWVGLYSPVRETQWAVLGWNHGICNHRKGWRKYQNAGSRQYFDDFGLSWESLHSKQPSKALLNLSWDSPNFDWPS